MHKENIRNYFEVLNLSDRKPEEQCNEIIDMLGMNLKRQTTRNRKKQFGCKNKLWKMVKRREATAKKDKDLRKNFRKASKKRII